MRSTREGRVARHELACEPVRHAQGRWYITAGLNPLFDTFDCQAHFFGVPEPGKLLGKINWRINKGNDDFIERSTQQRFIQARLSAWSCVCRACCYECVPGRP